jgi:hypothetical protein
MTRLALIAVTMLAACGDQPSPNEILVANGETPRKIHFDAVQTPSTAPPIPAKAVSAAEPAFNERQLTAYPKARGMPGDVQHFIARYEDCEHWTGEEPYDADRGNEITAAIEETCRGIDARLRDLKTRYHASPDIAAALASYEMVRL